MAMLAMAIPISAGKTERRKKFLSELNGARNGEFAASRSSLGVRLSAPPPRPMPQQVNDSHS